MSAAEIPETVSDIMTRELVTIGEDDRIASAAEHMKKYRFRHLPVVRHKKLVGLITQRDLLKVSSTPFSKEKELRDEMISYLPAKDVMRSEVVTIAETMDVVAAGEMMSQLKIGCLCVTNEEDELIGIVTEADYVKLAVRLVRGMRRDSRPSIP